MAQRDQVREPCLLLRPHYRDRIDAVATLERRMRLVRNRVAQRAAGSLARLRVGPLGGECQCERRCPLFEARRYLAANVAAGARRLPVHPALLSLDVAGHPAPLDQPCLNASTDCASVPSFSFSGSVTGRVGPKVGM